MSDQAQGNLKEEYERWRPAMSALEEKQLLPMNISASRVVHRCVGRLPRLRELEPDLVAQFGDAPRQRIVELEQQAWALLHAEIGCQQEKKPDLRALSKQVLFHRERLLLAARSLANWGHIDPERLERVPSPLGYANQTNGVMLLRTLLTQARARSSAPLPFTDEDLNEADRIATELIVAQGYERMHRGRPTPAQEIRVRAFTLVSSTYDLLRRDVSWLRWPFGDADEWLPAMNTNKGRRGKRTKPDGPQEPEQP